MKRTLPMAIVLCVLTLVSGSIALGQGVRGPHPAIVRIMALETGGASFGSGTLVAVTESHGLVVTNWHVVRDATGPITVFFPDGFHSGATVLRTDRDWDLAALAIWRPKASPVPVSSEAPRPGEMLTIAGYGSGEFRAVAGRCTQYVSPGGNHPYEMVELDAPARNGDSGGPILNSHGELAGVLFGTAFGRTTGSYSGRLRWFLNSVISDFQQMPTPAMLAQQQSPSQSPPSIASQSTVPPGTSLASQPGMQPTGSSGNSTAWPPTALAPTVSIPTGAEASQSAPVVSTGGTLPPASTPASSTTASSSLASNSDRHTPASLAAQKLPASPPLAQVNATSSSGSTSQSLVAAASPQNGRLPSIDQLKTLFAAIGVLVVLYQALRLLGSAVG
jgi:hypothetical protein